MSKPKHESVLDPRTFESVRDGIADTMHAAARAIADPMTSEPEDVVPGEAASVHEAVDWKQKSSQWLDHWSEELRRWDATESEAKLREAISKHPGRVLLLAGVAGLVLGNVLRRR